MYMFLTVFIELYIRIYIYLNQFAVNLNPKHCGI